MSSGAPPGFTCLPDIGAKTSVNSCQSLSPNSTNGRRDSMAKRSLSAASTSFSMKYIRGVQVTQISAIQTRKINQIQKANDFSLSVGSRLETDDSGSLLPSPTSLDCACGPLLDLDPELFSALGISMEDRQHLLRRKSVLPSLKPLRKQ